MGRELGRRPAYRGGFDEIRRLERRGGRTSANPLLAAVAGRGFAPNLRTPEDFDDSGLLAVLGRAAYTKECPNTK